MKTFMRQGLSLSFLGLLTAAAAQASSVNDRNAGFSLDMAEAFSNASLAVAQDEHLMGDFRRGPQEFEHTFERTDHMVQGFFQDKNLKVVKISARAQDVRFEIEDGETLDHFYTHAVQDVIPESLQKQFSEARYMLPGTSLTIEQTARWENPENGTFTMITRGTNVGQETYTGIGGYARVDQGLHKGPFSLSVFGVGDGAVINAGVSGTLTLTTHQGWTFSVYAQVAEMMNPVLSVSQGKYSMNPEHRPDAVTIVSISRVWEGTGIKTSAGVKMVWTGGDTFSAEAQNSFFVGLGRTFKDSRGRDRGAIDLLASAKMHGSRPEWILGIQATFSF